VEDKHAHYCFTVKDSPQTLNENIAELALNEDFPPEHETCEKGHGRLDIRKIWTTTEINEYVTLPYCGQRACINRQSENLNSEEIRREATYLITSLSLKDASPTRSLALNRGHWCIENRSFYVLDVTFEKDRPQIRAHSGPRLMATLRNCPFSLLRPVGHPNIAKAARHLPAKPHLALRFMVMKESLI
jgi:predicted transposase YbfD/YdcC